jgi:rRNA maturation endonuclease Nob1
MHLQCVECKKTFPPVMMYTCEDCGKIVNGGEWTVLILDNYGHG